MRALYCVMALLVAIIFFGCSSADPDYVDGNVAQKSLNRHFSKSKWEDSRLPDFFKASDDKDALKKLKKWGEYFERDDNILYTCYTGIWRPIYRIEINDEQVFYSKSLDGYIDISANGATVRIVQIFSLDPDGGYVLKSFKMCDDATLSEKWNLKRELGDTEFRVLSDFTEYPTTEMDRFCSVDIYTAIQPHQKSAITVRVYPNGTSDFKAFQYDIRTKYEHHDGPMGSDMPMSDEAFVLKLLQLPVGAVE